jgi:hypothetical protein
LAAFGVQRATLDRDLFVVEGSCLVPAFWQGLPGLSGAAWEIRKGDLEDPLAGLVRFQQPGQAPVDLVVGKHRWQLRLLERTRRVTLDQVDLWIPEASDLILLKLFAGGPQDCWDIQQMLASPESEQWIAEVGVELDQLPARSRALWRRLTEGGTHRSDTST